MAMMMMMTKWRRSRPWLTGCSSRTTVIWLIRSWFKIRRRMWMRSRWWFYIDWEWTVHFLQIAFDIVILRFFLRDYSYIFHNLLVITIRITSTVFTHVVSTAFVIWTWTVSRTFGLTFSVDTSSILTLFIFSTFVFLTKFSSSYSTTANFVLI